MNHAYQQLDVGQRRQLGLITLAALAIFVFLRWLPTGSNLSHMDFRVDAANSIEFCDPSNPQFIPVVAVASPVSLTVSAPAARAGEPVRATVMLRTANGKPIATRDLLVVHTRRLHLLISDPTLTDYQHAHPEPTGNPGEWAFEFTPQRGGAYRIFADFTPAATNRGLYANTDLNVVPSTAEVHATELPATPGLIDGYHFKLNPASQPLRARRPIDLQFAITRSDGGDVPLEPVMEAYAHLVAFDETRSGFAHLHPIQADPLAAPGRAAPQLDFRFTVPAAGRYVIWAQVNLAGKETFVPFWFDIEA